MAYLTTTLALQVLLIGLSRMVDIRYVPMADAVARLESHDDGRAILYLDQDSSAADLSWALLDALRAVTDGPDAALDGVRVARLRAVS